LGGVHRCVDELKKKGGNKQHFDTSKFERLKDKVYDNEIDEKTSDGYTSRKYVL
jgi:hypothetical protein